MVKYCIVVDCINSKDNQKEKKKLKQQKNSLFTLPKNPEVIRQWSQILGQDLAPDLKCNQFICDQHFEEDYIIRNDVISIPGQKSFVSERKKIILKRDAIPILNKNIDQESTSSNKCESVAVTNDEAVVVNQELIHLQSEYRTNELNVIGEAEC
ncbi:uncharacterized protein LOC141537597 isoform X2 [Cotesia typhae]|uniref:uncharacterized protein LOC141537597 isoform X2 n=1 Tax=Cotesia typhae TaxID=2053667 RepID=UPI003D68E058